MKKIFLYTSKLFKLKVVVLTLLFVFGLFHESNAQDCTTPISIYPWVDDFESGLSSCYNQIITTGNSEWILREGGYQASSGLFGYPQHAHSGYLNLYFFSETIGTSTKIVLPKFDLEGGENTTLSFWHAQYPWSEAQDVLKVYYRNSIISEWVLLETYSNPVEEWTEQIIELPNPTATYWIAFEGISNFGRGIVIDDVTVNCSGCMARCDKPRNVSRVMHSPNYFDVRLIWNAPDTTGYDIEIVGYNIYQNSRDLVNETPIQDLFYQLENLDPIGSYEYGITVVYSDGCESEKAPVNFTLNNPTEINMPVSGTITYTTCNGIIYDNGGPSSNYSNNCNGIMIIYPELSDVNIQIQGSYSIESSNDKLYIYEGAGITGSLLGSYSGSNGIISPIESTSGPMTLRFTSDGNGVNSGFVLHVSCNEIEDCLPPSNITASVQDFPVVNVAWTATVEDAISWNLEWGQAGFSLGTGNNVSNIDVTNYIITGTNPLSTYDVYIQTNCADGDVSDWSSVYSFSTPCGALSVPSLENFSSTTFPPSCWERLSGLASNAFLGINPTGTTSGWSQITNAYGLNAPHAKVKISGTSCKYWLVTPEYNLDSSENVTLTFDVALTDFSNGNEPETVGDDDKFMVIISTDGGNTWLESNAIIWDNIGTDYVFENIPSIGQTISIPLNYTGNIKIAFYCESTVSNADNDLHIGNVMIGPPLTCPHPNGLVATLPTDNSINLSWTAGGAETSWNIQYGAEGFVVGNGIIIENAGNPYNLTGLIANTSYDVYVQAVCGTDDVSSWTGPCTFHTICAAMVIPFTENFDSYGTGTGTKPECWMVGGTYSTLPYCYATNSHSAPASLRLYSTSTTYTYAVLPQVDITSANTLQVGLWGYSPATANTLQIGVMTNPEDISTFSAVQTISVSASSTWEYFEIALDSYSGTGNYIAFKSQRNSANTFLVDDVFVSPLPACPKPTYLTASNPTETTISLSWASLTMHNSWNIEYGLNGFTQGTGTIINNISDNPYTLTGLSASTSYSVYVQANCEGEEPSEWSSVCDFSTTCASETIPFTENFDSYGASGSSVFPNCWTRMYSASAANPYIYTAQKYSAPACLYFNTSASNYSIAITPQLIVETINTLQVRFMGRASNLNHKLQIGVMTDPGNADTFTPVDTIQVSTTNTWEEFEISFANYSGTGKYVAFKSDRRDENSANSFYMDNVIIENIPTCQKPNELTAINPTSTSIDLAWTAGGSETLWNLEYGILGFTQGTGTLIQNVENNPYTLTGLSSNTFYDVYVQAVCGTDDVSVWRGPVSFNTACGIESAPFFENFDYYGTGNSARPACWTIGGTYSTLPYCYANYNHSSPASLRLYSTSSTYVYAATPEINVENINTLQVEFWGYSTSTSNTVELGVMTDPLDMETFTSISTLSLSTPSTWTSFEIPLNQYSGTGKYVAFKSARSATNTFFIDDVLIYTIPSCPRPSYLTLENVTARTVTLDWENAGTEPNWEIEYGVSGFEPGTGTGQTIIANSHPYTVTGLLSETTYDFYLRAICGAGDTSISRDLFNVTTLISCPTPSSLSVFEIASNSVTLEWLTNGNENSWEIEYGISGFQPGIGVGQTVMANYHPFSVTGLLSETTYDFYLRAVCGVNDSSLRIHLNNVTTLTSCPAPTGLACSVTPTSAMISWTENGSATSWILEYGLSGFVLGTGTSVSVSNNPNTTITDLTTGVPYQCYVRSACGESDLSSWTGPRNFTPNSGVNGCVVIGEGTTGTYALPLNTYYNYSYSQQIITVEELVELDVLPGSSINSIAFQYIYSTAQTKNPVIIYLGEVDRTNFSSDTNWEPAGNMEQVFNGSVTFNNTGEDNWVEIEFDSPYIWNGDNLIIAMVNNHGSYSTSSNNTFYKHTATGNKSLCYQTDSGGPINPDSFSSSGSRSTDRSNIQLCVTSGGGSMCRSPKNFAASNITATSLQLSWEPRGVEQSWDIEYGLTGFIPGTGQHTVAPYYPYLISNLTPSSTYDFYIRAICGEGDTSDVRPLLNITTTETCIRPSNLLLSGISATTATITWTENGGSSSWNIEYGREGFELGTGIPLYNVTNPCTIIGLEGGVHYDCYVRSVCSEDNMSVWVGPIAFSSVTTNCGIIGEGTTGTYALPLNTYYNYSYSQQIITVEELADLNVLPETSINSIAFQYIYSTAQTKNSVIIYLGEVDRTNFSSNTNWEPAGNMEQVFNGSITFNNTGEDNWVEIEFDSPYIWNGNNLIIAMVNNHGSYSTSNNNTFYKHTATGNKSLCYQTDSGGPINPDNFSTSGTRSTDRSNIKLCFVQNQQNSCLTPTNVTISNITSTSVGVLWTNLGPATSWNIELGARGFTPTTHPTHNNITNPITLTGLTPNSDYAFYIQSNCSEGENSDWDGPYFFSTACDLVLEIPFVESFEDGEKPLCWLNTPIEGNLSWSYRSGCFESTPETAFDGNFNALLYSPGDRSVTRLITPTINLSGLTETPILAFAHAQPRWGYGQDKLSVWVKNSQNGSWSRLIEYTESIEDWTEESLILPNPTATYWIAFEVEGNWGHGVALDKVTVVQSQVAVINGNSSACAFGTETYSTTAGMSGYVWEVIGGEIVSGQGTNTISVTWGEIGAGMVSVLYSGLTYTNDLAVTINEAPLAAVYATDYEICIGQTTTLYVLGEGNYLWSTGETTSSIVVSPSTTTTYSVSVYENEQCATNLEIEIVVDEFNEVDILGDNQICFGESTILTAIGGEEYLWSTGETTASIEVSPAVETHYSVLVSNEIGCSRSDSIAVYVTHSEPTSGLNTASTNNSIVLEWEHSVGASKYYIYRDEEKIDSVAFNYYEDRNISFNIQYCYFVTVLHNNCESGPSNISCDKVDFDDIEENENNIRIYPNPVNTNLTVEGINMEKITLYNIMGQKLAEFETHHQSSVTINTSIYESGFYIIRMERKDGNIISKRFVIAH